MVLQVDPAELAAAAAKFANLARAVMGGVPNGWVMPAGSDPISAQAVPQLNDHTAALMNGITAVLDRAHRTARKVGDAAQGYSAADDEGSRVVGGEGAEVLRNPVPEMPAPRARRAPTFTLPAAGATVDPLTFAQQLRAGPGTGPATRLAGDIRQYLGTRHVEALSGVDAASAAMQHWTPTGSAAAAELGRHRGWLDQLGTTLGHLADGIDTYTAAFDTAKAKHPTPEEIIAAREELIAAMRSKNELGIQDALAKFQEQNARSAQTIGDYSTAVGAQEAANAADSDTGTAAQAADATGSGGEGNQTLSTLAQMLPSLMSSMMAAGMPMLDSSSMGDGTGYLDDYGYGNYDYSDYGYAGGGGDYGGGFGGGDFSSVGDITGAMNSSTSTPVTVGPMPTAAASASTVSGLPRTPVIEPLSANAAGAARGTAGGSPMMPYMPMSPGMGAGAGGNNERNRVVAWHPDRLMYVDDTPHTDAVIGEKPTIAPTVTPATPVPAKQAPTSSGGTA